MAGPGIRSYHIARVLAEQLPGATVTLAVPSATDISVEDAPFEVRQYGRASLGPLARAHDILVTFSLPLELIPFTFNTRVVLDLYGVFLPEWLEIANTVLKPSHRRGWVETQRRKLNVQLTWADFILYANERQRHLYLGMLSALGQVTPAAYAKDKELKDLLGFVPFGVRPGEPKATKKVLKGVRPGIRDGDKVLIWNGMINKWYDLATLIRAIHRLSQERDDIKLFFLGTELPSLHQRPKLQGMGSGEVRLAIRLCEELELLDRFVFFNIDWVDYEETTNYLLEADIGVCTYFRGLETEYSFRTRLLDLFWTERPIICTQGDALAELVAQRPLGIAVPPGDEVALADAIRRLADDEAFAQECKRNLQLVKEEYRWEKVLEPLTEYCRRPAPNDPRKRYRLLPLASRLSSFGAARLWQLVSTRRWGPRYL